MRVELKLFLIGEKLVAFMKGLGREKGPGLTRGLGEDLYGKNFSGMEMEVKGDLFYRNCKEKGKYE